MAEFIIFCPRHFTLCVLWLLSPFQCHSCLRYILSDKDWMTLPWWKLYTFVAIKVHLFNPISLVMNKLLDFLYEFLRQKVHKTNHLEVNVYIVLKSRTQTDNLIPYFALIKEMFFYSASTVPLLLKLKLEFQNYLQILLHRKLITLSLIWSERFELIYHSMKTRILQTLLLEYFHLQTKHSINLV